MGITPRFSQTETQRKLARDYQMILNRIIRQHQFVGEEFVRDARNAVGIGDEYKQRILTMEEQKAGHTTPKKGDYLDQTTNLRSSIGYFVLSDGETMFGKIWGKTEGVQAGIALANTVPVKRGYVQLIGVAGMEYASYVESRGYNVITSQKGMAIVSLERKLQKLTKALEN